MRTLPPTSCHTLPAVAWACEYGRLCIPSWSAWLLASCFGLAGCHTRRSPGAVETHRSTDAAHGKRHPPQPAQHPTGQPANSSHAPRRHAPTLRTNRDVQSWAGASSRAQIEATQQQWCQASLLPRCEYCYGTAVDGARAAGGLPMSDQPGAAPKRNGTPRLSGRRSRRTTARRSRPSPRHTRHIPWGRGPRCCARPISNQHRRHVRPTQLRQTACGGERGCRPKALLDLPAC
jgi:hypothetical protein